jgi:RND family efflux transporter MFP subunit
MRRTILALAMLAVPLSACGGNKQAGTAATAPSGPRLVLHPGETANWQDVSAEIATVDQAQVNARIPGILTSLTVREGDMVRKGQVIGRIVDNQLGYQAAAIAAQVAQAQSELKRVRFLYDNGVYAKARLEQAQAAAATAQAQYAAANAIAGQGAVVAPASGRVLKADVPAGSAVAPGTPIAVITAGATIVRLEMPESLAGKVRVGSRVTSAGLGTGSVVKVYPSIAAGTVSADVNMPGIDNSLIGRRLAAKIETGSRKGLLVPSGYVTSRYGIDYVTVLARDHTASQVPVQIAPSTEPGMVEILSGASAGDTLIGQQPGSAAK